CTIEIPPRTYTQTTTISLPLVSYSYIYKLKCEYGATLHYTGSNYAINIAAGGVVITDCQLAGTGKAAGGIQLDGTQWVSLNNLRISEFSRGDAIYNHGTNTVSIRDSALFHNRNGIHAAYNGTVGQSIAMTIIGTTIWSNSGWGVYEETATRSYPNCSNIYIGDVIQYNGTNGVSGSGQVFIQGGYSTRFQDDYFEQDGKNTHDCTIQIGDSTHTAHAPLITANFFNSHGVRSTICNAASQGAVITNNFENAHATNLIDQGSSSAGTIVLGNEGNYASLSTSYAGFRFHGDSVMQSCGTATFRSSTTSSNAVCGFIPAHCTFSGSNPPASLADLYYSISGKNVSLTSSTRGSGSFTVACSPE
ncbi:MAG TPA: hypothetical protein VGG42_07905, partial [Acidobacteriaceae bacterium]